MCLLSPLRHVLALIPIIQIDANHLCCYTSDKMRKCKCSSEYTIFIPMSMYERQNLYRLITCACYGKNVYLLILSFFPDKKN